MPKPIPNPWVLFILPVIAITTGLGLFFRKLSPGQVNFGLALCAFLMGAYFLTVSARERVKLLKWLFYGSGLVMTLVGMIQLVFAVIR